MEFPHRVTHLTFHQQLDRHHVHPAIVLSPKQLTVDVTQITEMVMVSCFLVNNSHVNVNLTFLVTHT